MRVVLDTNIVLPSLGRKSTYRPIFEAIATEKIELILSTPILLEYEEILRQRAYQQTVDFFFELLMESNRVTFIDPQFQWRLIAQDPDDNKFVDATIAANADFLVTDDHHLDVLKRVHFPPINIISGSQFVAVLQAQKSEF